MVGTLDSDQATKTLFKTTSRVLYAEPGYLLFVRENTLVAQKFDAKSPALEGDAVPLGEGLGVDSVGPRVVLGLAERRAGVPRRRAAGPAARVGRIDAGKETPAIDALGDYRDVVLRRPTAIAFVFDVERAPDGSDDLDPRPGARRDVAVHVRRRASSSSPVWSPDGRRIVYTSRDEGPRRPVPEGRLGHARARAAAGVTGGEVRVRLVAGRQVRALHRTRRRPRASTSGRCR